MTAGMRSPAWSWWASANCSRMTASSAASGWGRRPARRYRPLSGGVPSSGIEMMRPVTGSASSAIGTMTSSTTRG